MARLTNKDRIIIDPFDDDFGTVLMCAVRYALGRCTYMPKLVIDFIKLYLPKLNDKTLWCFVKDIESAPSLGHEEIDKPLWLCFLADVKAEQERRKTNEGSDKNREASACDWWPENA